MRGHATARAGYGSPACSLAGSPGASRAGSVVLQRDLGGCGRSDGHGHVDPISRAGTVSARRERSGESAGAGFLGRHRCRTTGTGTGCRAGMSNRVAAEGSMLARDGGGIFPRLVWSVCVEPRNNNNQLQKENNMRVFVTVSTVVALGL